MAITIINPFAFSPAPARYWRITGAVAQYMHLRNDLSYFSGVFESTDLTGTDIAAALSIDSTISFRVGATNAKQNDGGANNPFVNTAGFQNYVDLGGAGDARLWFDFGSAVVIRSIQLEVPDGLGDRWPTSALLECSNDDSVWAGYATLTKGAAATRLKFLAITLNSTIADSGP